MWLEFPFFCYTFVAAVKDLILVRFTTRHKNVLFFLSVDFFFSLSTSPLYIFFFQFQRKSNKCNNSYLAVETVTKKNIFLLLIAVDPLLQFPVDMTTIRHNHAFLLIPLSMVNVYAKTCSNWPLFIYFCKVAYYCLIICIFNFHNKLITRLLYVSM